MSSSTTTTSTPTKPLEVVFIHLDLGIGGAEQLVLSLAQASVEAGHTVHLVTTNCRPDHCFSLVQPPDGFLCQHVSVWGNWIPPNIFCQVGTALCSSIRLLYLAFWTCRKFPNANVVVLDVLSTPIPFLLPYFSVLFYCHFPDKLLVRDTVNGETTTTIERRSTLKRLYRKALDKMEEETMSMADLLVVNSNFTRQTIQNTFPSLSSSNKPMRVLYPALQCTLDKTIPLAAKTSKSPIVSLNRYERKKNIELLLHAYAMLLKQQQHYEVPPLVIAGGYDTHNVENVQYRAELEQLATQLGIVESVTFLLSISDETRTSLLREALVVVYTPHLEHFGIVPLESMLAGTPVIACKSGGPKETILHEKTGYLCEDQTPQAFCEALVRLVGNPALATQMGHAGRNHVLRKFSQARFQQEWIQLVQEAVENGIQRHSNYSYTLYKALPKMFEAMVVLVLVWIVTWSLRKVGLLEQDEYIVGSIKRALLNRDEL